MNPTLGAAYVFVGSDLGQWPVYYTQVYLSLPVFHSPCKAGTRLSPPAFEAGRKAAYVES